MLTSMMVMSQRHESTGLGPQGPLDSLALPFTQQAWVSASNTCGVVVNNRAML